MMDEPRKKILAIMTAVLAERRLTEKPAEVTDAMRVQIIYEAMQHAERILNSIDARWSANRIPGKT
jgi:hypothetical protein